MTRNIIEVKTLLGHKNLDFSIECLKSFIDNSYDNVHLSIFEDGSITELDKKKLLTELKDSVIISKRERDTKVTKALANYPNCCIYRNNTNYAQKLFDVMVHDDEDLLFVDSDVLFLRKFKLPDFGGIPTFMKDTEHAYSFNPIEFFKIYTPIYPSINSGFFYFPKASFNLSFIEGLLKNETIHHSFNSCISWSEQTTWSFLAATLKTVNYFNQKEIVMAKKKLEISPDTIAVHLVSTYRSHFQELKKLTSLTCQQTSHQEVQLEKGSRYLSKIEFAIERIMKRVKRKLHY